MWALDFMRVERSLGLRVDRWRAWDVLRIPSIRPPHSTTFHKTLRAAKDHCEAIVAGALS